jgi:hypothetical protein
MSKMGKVSENWHQIKAHKIGSQTCFMRRQFSKNNKINTIDLLQSVQERKFYNTGPSPLCTRVLVIPVQSIFLWWNTATDINICTDSRVLNGPANKKKLFFLFVFAIELMEKIFLPEVQGVRKNGLLFFSTGISDTVPRWFFCCIQVAILHTTITRHHCHHFPTLSLEHLSQSLKPNLALHLLLTLSSVCRA